MIRKIIPVILLVLGLGLGGAAGIFLKPSEEAAEEMHDAEAGPGDKADAHDTSEVPEDGREYVKLNSQFVVPVVEDGHVINLVIMSLSLEVTAGSSELVYSREPKLRDALLRVLWDHANAGGFKGTFTDGNTLTILRNALREQAISTMGNAVTDVLIADLTRQDA